MTSSFFKIINLYSMRNTVFVPRILPSGTSCSQQTSSHSELPDKKSFLKKLKPHHFGSDMDRTSTYNLKGRGPNIASPSIHHHPLEEILSLEELLSQTLRKTASLPKNFHSRRYHRSVSRGDMARNSQEYALHEPEAPLAYAYAQDGHLKLHWVTEQKELCRKSLSDTTERGRPRKREARDHASWFRSNAPSPRSENRRFTY